MRITRIAAAALVALLGGCAMHIYPDAPPPVVDDGRCYIDVDGDGDLEPC